MSESILDIGIIGLGVGEQHALAYISQRECRLRYLYDMDTSKMDRVQARLKQGAVVGSIEEILEDETIDVLSIASYDDAHGAHVLAALKTGKHVFVEKPLCCRGEELQDIKALWTKTNASHLRSNLVLRAAPLYRWLKEAIENGELGEIYGFDGEYLYGRLTKITNGWRKDVDDYSVMLGGGIHLVDLLLWLTGMRPQSVTAAGNQICSRGTAFRYLDYVSATFTFASGLVGRVTANFGCVHRHQHVLRIYGTKGTFIYDDMGPRLHHTRDSTEKATSVSLAPLPASKGALIYDFVKGILGGVDDTMNTQHEFDVVSVCLAVDQGLLTGHTIPVNYV